MRSHRLLAILGLTACAAETLPKANEYKTDDCSGDINYGHHNSNLIDVTMDDTTHSLYLAGAQWVGFTDKTGDGGSCYGDMLVVVGECNKLNKEGRKRIKCVRNVS